MAGFRLKIIGMVALVLFLGACGTVSALIEAITSADCDDFLQTELTSTLSDDCQALADYLDAESDSLTELSQVLPTPSLSDAGMTFLQLTDAEGNPLSGIDASDVTVEVSTDGGTTFTEVPGETVQTLSDIETTQTAILAVIDYSASISDGDLNDVVSGMNVFLNTLEVGYAGGIEKFSDNVDLTQDFTETEDDLTSAVNDTSYTRGMTSLNDAIYDGVTALAARDEPLRLMLLFTDGIDNDSDHSLDEAVAYAVENDIPVCIVGVTFADTDTLEAIAEQTGCFYIYKQFFTSLDSAFADFADQINNLHMVTLPDDFAAASGILRVTVDAGEETAREFTREF